MKNHNMELFCITNLQLGILYYIYIITHNIFGPPSLALIVCPKKVVTISSVLTTQREVILTPTTMKSNKNNSTCCRRGEQHNCFYYHRLLLFKHLWQLNECRLSQPQAISHFKVDSPSGWAVLVGDRPGKVVGLTLHVYCLKAKS